MEVCITCSLAAVPVVLDCCVGRVDRCWSFSSSVDPTVDSKQPVPEFIVSSEDGWTGWRVVLICPGAAQSDSWLPSKKNLKTKPSVFCFARDPPSPVDLELFYFLFVPHAEPDPALTFSFFLSFPPGT